MRVINAIMSALKFQNLHLEVNACLVIVSVKAVEEGVIIVVHAIVHKIGFWMGMYVSVIISLASMMI
jgi:hypothetical protein